MKTQSTLVVGGFDAFSKRTRKAVFLERMDMISVFGDKLLGPDMTATLFLHKAASANRKSWCRRF
jgi:hypothetical protein